MKIRVTEETRKAPRETVERMFSLLHQILDQSDRQRLVLDYVALVSNTDEDLISPEADEILSELAFDLDFYEPNPEWRAEDPSYFGDERLEREIKEAFAKLRALGVELPAERPPMEGSS